MQKKLYVDWSNKKGLITCNDNLKIQTFKDVSGAFKKKNIYIERGCPRNLLQKIYDKANSVFLIDGQEVKKLRKKLKTDEEDARTIKQGVENNEFHLAKLGDDFFKRSELRPIYNLRLLYLKLNVRAKNIISSLKRESDKKEAIQRIQSVQKEIDKVKKQYDKDIIKDYKGYSKKLGIRGIGDLLISSILILAHPKYFPHWIPYQKYCGYRNNCGNKYSRLVKSLFYQCTGGIIKTKNKKLYPLYNEIKERFLTEKDKYAEDKRLKEEKYKKVYITHKSWSHKKAVNRLSSLICKEFWMKFNKS